MAVQVFCSVVAPWPAATDATRLAQRSAASQASPSISISPVDPALNEARLQKYLRALGAPLRMGQDASHIADALVSTMQSIVQERPDLANAPFDFKTAGGALQVVAPDLSATDRQWLEATLNANTRLLSATAQFHDDAVAGYTQWASASGHSLTPEESGAVERQADDLTGFLTLFQNLGASAAKGMFSDGAYYAPDGSRVGFDQAPTTANGFLSFIQSAKTLAAGSARWIAPDGSAHYGVLKNDIFANAQVIPHFFPNLRDGLGVSEVA
jgi:hypothetical protein